MKTIKLKQIIREEYNERLLERTRKRLKKKPK